MFKSNFLFVCLMGIGCHAAQVTFIDKCDRSDKACLITSSQKALPYLASGDSSLGLSPLDPLKVESATYEGDGLSITFKDITATNLGKCKIVEINRDDISQLIVGLECPVEARGTYTASGKLLNSVPVEGNGPFLVKVDDLYINVKAAVAYVDGSDGEKHWSLKKEDFSFEPKGKSVIEFQNLFNGDEAKAAPINDLLAKNSASLIVTIGRPLVNAVVDKVVEQAQILADIVPAKDLEI